MAYKRVLIIQDISCVGQCSMTVALPILSACGHESCMLPTALLSTHTGGFGKPAVIHMDSVIPDIWRHWRVNGITFDCILVGYLGSIAAVAEAEAVIDAMLTPGGIVIVDPAMADNGKLYSGFDDSYAAAVMGLCRKADIILPNITEASMLAGENYRESQDENYVNFLLEKINHPCTVLTGVGFADGQTGVMLYENGKACHYPQERIGASFHGTGDMFAACFTGALLQGRTKREAVEIAADFTHKSIKNTVENPAHWYGVKFEPVLSELIARLAL